jgi:hypothetical protein
MHKYIKNFIKEKNIGNIYTKLVNIFILRLCNCENFNYYHIGLCSAEQIIKGRIRVVHLLRIYSILLVKTIETTSETGI